MSLPLLRQAAHIRTHTVAQLVELRRQSPQLPLEIDQARPVSVALLELVQWQIQLQARVAAEFIRVERGIKLILQRRICHQSQAR